MNLVRLCDTVALKCIGGEKMGSGISSVGSHFPA